MDADPLPAPDPRRDGPLPLPGVLREPPLVLPARRGPYRLRHCEAVGEPAWQQCELILGRFYAYPSVTALHELAKQCLMRRLERLAHKLGGVAWMGPFDVILSTDTIVKPDVWYVSAGRRKATGDGACGVPDLVVEVLSDDSARIDRREKLIAYTAAGVLEYWLIDPRLRIVELMIHRDGQMIVRPPTGARYRSERLAGIHLHLRGLWRDIESGLRPLLRPEAGDAPGSSAP